MSAVCKAFRRGLRVRSELRRDRSNQLVDQVQHLLELPSTAEPPAQWQDMSWATYLAARGFVGEAFANASPHDQEVAVTLMSSMLSFPLTVASAWNTLRLSEFTCPSICIVGAANEAEQVFNIWDELCILSGQSVQVEFLGPEVTHSTSESRRIPSSWNAEMSLHAKWTAGILQDADPERLSKHHAFCVFHPGVGTNFRYPWYKAFKAMKQTRRPVLLSAYDLDDAQRDIFVLTNGLYGVDQGDGFDALFDDRSLVYQKNHWASTSDQTQKGPSFGIPLQSVNGYVACAPCNPDT